MGRSGEGEKREEMAGEEEGMKGSGTGRKSKLPEEDESERDGSDIWRGGGEAIQERRERGGSQPRGLTE